MALTRLARSRRELPALNWPIEVSYIPFFIAVDVLAYVLFVHCLFVDDKMVLQLLLSILCSSFCATAVDVVLAYVLFVHCLFVDKMVLQLLLSILCSLHFVLLLLTLFLPTSCLSTVFFGDKMVLQLHLSVLCSLHSASDRQDSDPTCHLECQVGQTGLRQTGPQMPGH